jgi:ATP-dependent 26S proteasome regulatory subunit
MKHLAIYKLYSNVVTIRGDIAYDANDNVVEYDENAVITEANMMALRQERNRLIFETDWWASSDLTMTQAQTDYRQALRDITDSATSLDDVTWPTKP